MTKAKPGVCSKHGPHNGRCNPCARIYNARYRKRQLAQKRRIGLPKGKRLASRQWWALHARELLRQFLDCWTKGEYGHQLKRESLPQLLAIRDAAITLVDIPLSRAAERRDSEKF